tara:strand:- start:2159 stop:2761 length:603 start_codon:yes stop_codon:yes gene_type:complete
MKAITTKDGSITFFNEDIQDIYHSTSGAMEEAREKYVKPCKLKDGMRVLDVCFGLGYNAACALQEADVEVVALESDKEIMEKALDIPAPFPEFTIIQEEIKKCLEGKESFILLGDARKTIKEVQGKFDAVFFDPFSPTKQPELWTTKFFTDVKAVMKQGAILTTYSCAKTVRDALREIGFKVENGPCVGRKAPSTIAINK